MFVDCNHATYIASAWLTKVNGMFACRVPFALLQCHDDIESTCAGRTCNHTCCEASRKSRNHYRTQISGKYWLTVSPWSVPIELPYILQNCQPTFPGSTGKWSMDTVFRPMPRAWAGWPSDWRRWAAVTRCVWRLQGKVPTYGDLQVENRAAFCSHNSKTNAAVPAAALIINNGHELLALQHRDLHSGKTFDSSSANMWKDASTFCVSQKHASINIVLRTHFFWNGYFNLFRTKSFQRRFEIACASVFTGTRILGCYEWNGASDERTENRWDVID